MNEVERAPFPAGLPRDWYENSARGFKALTAASALLASGIAWRSAELTDDKVRDACELAGLREPSAETIGLVYVLLTMATASPGDRGAWLAHLGEMSEGDGAV